MWFINHLKSAAIRRISPTDIEKVLKMNNKTTKSFSLSAYVEQALGLAEYEKDENGIIVAHVPNAPVFFSGR